MAATYDEAYHPEGCTCEQPSGPISIQNYLRNCFYPRLMNRLDPMEERMICGFRSNIPQPKRKDFLNKEYKGTEIWDNSPRHPLLCLKGHYSWEEGSDKTPSSLGIVIPYTLSRLKMKIEKGDYIMGAHFKHHFKELHNCKCSEGKELGDKILAEQRNSTLASRSDSPVMVLQNFDNVYELKYYVHKQTGEITKGVHDIKNIDISNLPLPSSTSDLKDRVSFWMLSRDAGFLPPNCAGFLCFEDSDKKNSNLFIPDTGKMVLIIPKSKKEDFQAHLKKLKEDLNGVKMGPGKANTLNEDLPDYRQGIIEWNDSNGQELVKEFIKKITNLEMRKIRSTRPLKMQIYDQNYEPLTPVSIKRKTDFCLSPEIEYYLKIRRLRNTPLEGFRLLLGPGIVGVNLSLNGLEASSLETDEESGGTLWKIFVREKSLQNGLWATLSFSSKTDDAWIEIFDYGTSVEQSGMRIQIVSEESI